MRIAKDKIKNVLANFKDFHKYIEANVLNLEIPKELPDAVDYHPMGSTTHMMMFWFSRGICAMSVDVDYRYKRLYKLETLLFYKKNVRILKIVHVDNDIDDSGAKWDLGVMLFNSRIRGYDQYKNHLEEVNKTVEKLLLG